MHFIFNMETNQSGDVIRYAKLTFLKEFSVFFYLETGEKTKNVVSRSHSKPRDVV